MTWAGPVLAVLGRFLLGVLLAALLSVVGIGVAWAMFVFFGAVSHATLLTMFVTGAGLGAGMGAFGAFMRMDRGPTWQIMSLLFLVVVFFGAVGAWLGYQFGATREVECCTGPVIGPITYTSIGSVVGASLSALGVWLGQEWLAQRVRKKSGLSNPTQSGRAPIR